MLLILPLLISALLIGALMLAQYAPAEAKDSEVTSIAVTPPSLLLHEDGVSDAFYVSLQAPPSKTVVIQITINLEFARRAKLQINGRSGPLVQTYHLTFTAANYKTPQSVRAIPLKEYLAWENCADDTFTLTLVGANTQLAGVTEVPVKIVDAHKIVDTTAAPSSLTSEQLRCHKDLLQFSDSEKPGEQPSWWGRENQKTLKAGQTRSYRVSLTRDPGEGETVTVSIGFSERQGHIADLNTDVLAIKGGNGEFGSRATLTFSGGPTGNWDTGQLVSWRGGNVAKWYSGNLIHAISDFPGFVNGAGVHIALRVGP